MNKMSLQRMSHRHIRYLSPDEYESFSREALHDMRPYIVTDVFGDYDNDEDSDPDLMRRLARDNEELTPSLPYNMNWEIQSIKEIENMRNALPIKY